MNMSNNKYKEDNIASNFFMDVYQDGGASNGRFSKSEPYLEKLVYNLEDERTEKLIGSDVQEFTGNCFDNVSGLIERGVIMAGIEEEKCPSLVGLNDKINLEGLGCQHSKIREEYFDICSLDEDAAYEEENVSNSRQEGVCFSRKDSEIKSAGMGKVGPIHSGKKTKVKGVSRRKGDTKHLTTNEEHFVNDCGKSSSLSSVSSSDDARSGIDAEDQNGEADMLFLKLKSIGKLSVPDKKDTIFDLTKDSSVSLTSSSTEHLELKSKKEDACQKQNGSNPCSIPPTDNQSKNIRVPELHFDEVADAESSTKATKQSENKMKENKTRKNDELIRLSIPKEIHKSEMGRMKMKKRMYGKTEGSPSAHGTKKQVGKDEMMFKKEQTIQSDKNTWKTQGHSGTQVKTNDAKILSKRSEIVKRELRNFADVIPLPKSEKAEKCHSSCGVLVDTVACSDSSMASPRYSSFPSLSGRSSSTESSFMLTTTGSPCESVNTFQEFERQNLAERKGLKKQFRLKIAEAKKKLMEARLLAQKETAAKRFKEALKKHTEIKLKRASMKDSMSNSATPTLDPGPSSSSSVVPVRKTFKDVSLSILSAGVTNIQEIRKAEADFDRAKVKKFQTKMKLQKKKTLTKASADPQSKKLKSLKKKDRERLERYEVEKMISELRNLNMIGYADKLSQAIERKEEYEAKFRHELNEERKHAALLAKKQKLEELARIREEEKRKKMAEKERLEQQRREREALEIAKRQAEAMKRREHNLKLQESLNHTLLATVTSRSFTYSYLPVLKTPAAQIEKDDREKLKKVKARYLERS